MRTALVRHAPFVLAAVALVVAMGGTWVTATPAYAAPAAQLVARSPAQDEDPPRRAAKKSVVGKLNLNTATEDQLMMLPSIGPSKAERIIAWRKKHGAFRRVADLRRVKGFGYKTFKRLEPWLAINGDSTLAPR